PPPGTCRPQGCCGGRRPAGAGRRSLGSSGSTQLGCANIRLMAYSPSVFFGTPARFRSRDRHRVRRLAGRVPVSFFPEQARAPRSGETRFLTRRESMAMYTFPAAWHGPVYDAARVASLLGISYTVEEL